MLQPSITKICLKITCLKFHSNFRGANELNWNDPLALTSIPGGVFHTSDDLETPELWVDESQDADTQQQARITILHEAHFIIPRYSAMYRVPDCYKGSGMNVVITP